MELLQDRLAKIVNELTLKVAVKTNTASLNQTKKFK